MDFTPVSRYKTAFRHLRHERKIQIYAPCRRIRVVKIFGDQFRHRFKDIGRSILLFRSNDTVEKRRKGICSLIERNPAENRKIVHERLLHIVLFHPVHQCGITRVSVGILQKIIPVMNGKIFENFVLFGHHDRNFRHGKRHGGELLSPFLPAGNRYCRQNSHDTCYRNFPHPSTSSSAWEILMMKSPIFSSSEITSI